MLSDLITSAYSNSGSYSDSLGNKYSYSYSIPCINSRSDDAKRALVDAGYDPRLGARPMRRVVQKTVENIIAEKMLTGELVAGSGLRISLADIQASGGLEPLGNSLPPAA